MKIILVHNNLKVTSVLDSELSVMPNVELGNDLTKTLEIIKEVFLDTLIIWVYEDLLNDLNTDQLDDIFYHKRMLVSFNIGENYFLSNSLGYVERTFFIKINKLKVYPTWLMSSHVGGIHSEVLRNINLNYNQNFDYFLNSLSKRAMSEGLFCYSNPRLLNPNININIKSNTASTQELFKFVKEHYKWVWVFFLSLTYLVYENKITIFSLLKSLFNKQLSSDFNLEAIEVKSLKEDIIDKSIDVIIPTIGRKKYLHDVLKDLAKQTHLPKNVIIVEQNPEPNSVSELDYLTTENWPFNIKHQFIHQTGVCNARNLALKEIESDWCFLADDDIRFENNILENSFKKVETYGISTLNYLCLQKHQKQTYFKMEQTFIFGSGCSMVKSSVIENLKFDVAYEHGFGEDSDFGMQIRNNGGDVVFVPDIKIDHLKAPIGGYRTIIKQLWDDDAIKPQPSPTIQLLYQRYFTSHQLKGYRLLLFIKYYKSQSIKNPFKYVRIVNLKWRSSQKWAKKLQA